MMRTAVEGVPLAALSPATRPGATSTRRCCPQNLPKSGRHPRLPVGDPAAVAADRAVRDDAVSGTNLAVLRQELGRPLVAATSSRASACRPSGRRASATTPSTWTQATSAYALLAGPKRLYLGNLGHAPSTFASDDFPAYSERSVGLVRPLPQGTAERDRHAGRRSRSAPTPFVASGVRRYAGLPATQSDRRATTYRAGRTIAANAKVVTTPRAAAALRRRSSAPRR